MAIRKPNLSVTEARRLADLRAASQDDIPASMPLEASSAQAPVPSALPPPPVAPAPAVAVLEPAEVAPLTPSPPVMPARVLEPAPAVPTASPVGRKTSMQEAPVSPSRPPLSSFRQDEPDKVQIYLSAHYPRPGLSPTFELVCSHYPPHKALQMILRRALQDYDTLLESGQFQTISGDYEIDDRASPALCIQTSRMMEKPLLAIARAHFDPLNLESSRAFGRKLATAALAAFFAHEPKRPQQ